MNKISPLVSVILPVLNGGPYLLRAVNSILLQTYQHWELMLIDDGSTDGYLEKIRLLSDSRIRIFDDGLHKGLALRLNEGISYANGSYIARMDADDIAFPDRLQLQVAFLLSHDDIDLLATRVVAFNSIDESLIGLLPFEQYHREIVASSWRGIHLPHPTWMGRAEWFRRFPYRSPEVLRAEDQELLLRAANSSRYHCLPDVLLAYRQGPFNLMKTLTTRRSLACAQIKIFFNRRQYFLVAAVMATTLLKVIIDCLAAIPGMDGLFFRRMGNSVDSHSKNQYLMHIGRLY